MCFAKETCEIAVKVLLTVVMTAQQECSQFPLVEMESTISLPILFISSYDSTTGVFTVPSGEDGVYYFSTYLLVDAGEYGNFDMYLNNDVICSTLLDHTSSGVDDYPPGSCSAVANLVAGEECPFIVHIRTV